MLKKLYPEAYDRYLALPILGPILEDFDDWLIERGCTHSTRIMRISWTVHIEKYFQHQGRRSLSKLKPEDFDACSRHHRQNAAARAAAKLLRSFLESRNLLPVTVSEPFIPFRPYLEPYAAYLRDVRGFTHKTIHEHSATLSQFLAYLERQRTPLRLMDLTVGDFEGFIVLAARRLGRGSMQHVVGHLRGFLRYLAMKGEVHSGLEIQIDTPRQYRLEKLPRAISWETVCSLLESIDRKTPVGLRDYAVFLLMATYGLRASDIVNLKMDTIHWRHDEIWIHQRKTSQPLVLPLTDGVGSALLEYLRKGRLCFPGRQIFISVRAPIHPLGSTALSNAFQFWVKRSGLKIPFAYGPGCLRHSYAVHLLRQGISVKTIGDLMGHRTVESTCVYLRLDLEDLREVALSIPTIANAEGVR